jgi:hypothetical protein
VRGLRPRNVGDMQRTYVKSFVAECYWPDVREEDLAGLDHRIDEAIVELGATHPVRYGGAMLLREEEVVLCRFEGSAESVRAVAERAAIPYERILAAAHSPGRPS